MESNTGTQTRQKYWITQPWFTKLLSLGLILLSTLLMTLPFQEKNDQVTDSGEISSIEFSIPEKANAQEISAEDKASETGRIGEGISDMRDSSTTETARAKADATEAYISATGNWKATDYVSGEINSGLYQVKSGDTLWEIAEAVYGNGTQWTDILNANSEKINYLPDGEQALIIPGQFLTLL